MLPVVGTTQQGSVCKTVFPLAASQIQIITGRLGVNFDGCLPLQKG